jgi:hypothetical protein
MILATIKELYEKVRSGEIDGSKLEIRLDKDNTSFYTDSEEITVLETNGCMDTDKLYELLFPDANIDWA